MSKKSTAANEPADLGANARSAIIDALTQAMADNAVTQMKAQCFHWNVEGMGFGQLHELFETIYRDHFEAQDLLAERVRALSGQAEGRFAEYVKRAHVKESDGRLSDKEMITELRDDQRRMTATLQDVVSVADEHDDVGTADMATGRIEAHDKFAWMLSAHIGTR